MIVSHSKRLIFVANPKCGSRSIEAALEDYNEEPELNEVHSDGLYTKRHMPADVMRDRLSPSVWKTYFKFGVARNPWDWFVSQHFYNLEKRGHLKSATGKLSNEDVLGTFEYLRQYRGRPSRESASQHAFLCDNNLNILVDTVVPFRNINKSFESICNMLGIEANLPHLNKSAHLDYRGYFGSAARALVAKLYAKDIRVFGYEFDS